MLPGLACCCAALGLSTASLAAATWLEPSTLSRSGGDALVPQIALDPAGNAVAVWARARSNVWSIQASYRPLGGRWSPPRDLSRRSTLAGSPQVAVDEDGNAIAVWARSDGGNVVVEASSRPSSTGAWDVPLILSEPGGDALSPQLVVAPHGDALAIWARSDGTSWVVQAAHHTDGAWGPAEDVSEPVGGAVSPQVAVDARGNAVAVWAELVGTTWAVATAYRPVGGEWQASRQLATAGRYPRVRLQVAVDAGGNAVAVWEGLIGGRSVVQASSRPTGRRGTWGSAEPLSDPSGNAVSPQLTIDARGNAVAVWARSDGKNWIVQAAEYEAGVWRSARSLSGPGRDAVAPDVALDPRGGAVAAWARSNGTNTVVEAVFRRVPNGRWERPRTLSLAGGDAITPQAALDAQGNGAVIWSRYTGAAFVAQVSGYDAAGPALRDLAVPRRGTAGTPLRFSVSPLDVWSPLAITRWTFGDGSAADGEEAEHVYEQPGRYTVRVTSADTLGHRSTSSHTVVIAGAG